MADVDEEDEDLLCIPRRGIEGFLLDAWLNSVNELKFDGKRMFVKRDITKQFIQDEAIRFQKVFANSFSKNRYHINNEDLASFLNQSASIICENYVFKMSRKGLIDMGVNDKGEIVIMEKTRQKPKKRNSK
jgi:hypothetical protein